MSKLKRQLKEAEKEYKEKMEELLIKSSIKDLSENKIINFLEPILNKIEDLKNKLKEKENKNAKKRFKTTKKN